MSGQLTNMPFLPFVQRRFVGKIFSLSGEAYPATNKTLRIKHSNNQFFKNKYVSWCLFCKQRFYLQCWQTVLKRNFVKRVCEIKHRGRFEEKNGFRINSRRGGNRGRDCEIILGSGGRYKGRLNGWSPHHQLPIHQSYLRHHRQSNIIVFRKYILWNKKDLMTVGLREHQLLSKW